MEKTLTQLPLDFGPEPEVPSQPSVVGSDGAGDQGSGRYMAAAGVGVRVKSYKSPVSPVIANGELFPAAVEPLRVDSLPVEPEPIPLAPLAVEPEPIMVEQAPVEAAEPAVEAIVVVKEDPGKRR